MKVCSVCQRCYEDSVQFCTEENHEPPIDGRPGSREIIANYRLDVLLEINETDETYEATDTVLNQSCIIRILAADATGEKLRRQFLSEAQSIAAVSHPNVVRIYDFGVLASGEFYVVTEAVSGQTLRNCLQNVGSPSEVTAIQITRQAAEGLEAIHAAGAMHRNIKPENIILASDAENRLLVKIQNLDFGGVKQQITTSVKSNSESILNELKYLSPEQCAGQAIDARTDIYSLGIVLYEMLSGEPPFDAPDAAGLIRKQINEPPPPAKIATFDIRALLTHTLTDSLQKIPRVRLKTANAFARQLRHIEQLATHSPTPPPVMKVVQPTPKKTPIILPKLQNNEATAPTKIHNSLKEEVQPLTPPKQEIADLEIAEIAAEVPKEPAVVSVSPEDSVIEIIAIEDELNVQDEPKIENEPNIEPEPIFVEEVEASFVEEIEANFVEEIETISVSPASEPVLVEWEQPDDIPSEFEILQVTEKEFDEPDIQPEPIFVEEEEASFVEKVEASPISPVTEHVLLDWEQPDDIPSESEVLEVREQEFNEPEFASELVFLDEEDAALPISESEPIVIEIEKPQMQTAAENSIFSDDDYNDYYEGNNSGGFLSTNRSLFIGMGILTLLFAGIMSVLVNTQVELPTEQTTAQSAPISQSLPKSEESIAVPQSETLSTEKLNEPIPNDETTMKDNSDTVDSKIFTEKEPPVSPEKSVSSTSKRSNQNQTSKEIPDSITKVKQNKSPSKEMSSINKPKASPDKKLTNEKSLPTTTKTDIFSRPRVVKNAGL